ncbi:Longitudinals lacking protein, isoform G [Zootermopsis nevadensis]|uniref:Longitudinals lacking protein, isoform G n=1 Tax=Zootermopsis nevadensis TaxID=136037 RepID=A0A067RDG3_ZOONE|nr:Longitudinals lacking protein, isoform G [Zootermopsis nevadensis]
MVLIGEVEEWAVIQWERVGSGRIFRSGDGEGCGSVYDGGSLLYPADTLAAQDNILFLTSRLGNISSQETTTYVTNVVVPYKTQNASGFDCVQCEFLHSSRSLSFKCNFQAIQQNASFHQPGVRYIQTSNQRRYTDSGQFECPKCLKTYTRLLNVKFNDDPFSDFQGVTCGQMGIYVVKLTGSFLQLLDMNIPKKREDTNLYGDENQYTDSVQFLTFEQIIKEEPPEVHLSQIVTQLDSSPKVYSCPTCGKLYRWKSNMTRHRRQECGKEPQFQCPYCPKRTKQKGNLLLHMKSMHSSAVQL